MRRMALACLCIACISLLAAGCGKRGVPTRPDYPTQTETASPQPSSRISKPGPVPKGTFKPYVVRGKKYYPLSSANGFKQIGLASWYGKDFHGKKTANGETYNMHDMTAAHKTLPMNTYLRVTNQNNGKSAILRVNDRGPFVGSRILDLSYAGAKQLGVIAPGTAPVMIEAVRMEGQHKPSLAEQMANAAYYVQVGAFTVRANADRLAGKLRSTGYPQSRVTQAYVSGKKFWRVQAGIFSGMDRAKQAHAALKSNYPSSFVIAD